MAQQTLTLACTASAFVNRDNKYTNYHGAAYYNVLDNLDTKRVLLAFDSFPAALRKRIIYSARLSFSSQVSDQEIEYWITSYLDSFNENTVNFSTMPYDYIRVSRADISSLSLERIHYGLWLSELDAKSWAIYANISGYGITDSANVYTRNAAAANRPVITVVYDDTQNATSKVVCSLPANGKWVNPTQAISFSWALMPDPYESVDPFVQTSATFQWSSDNGSTWNSVAVSGSTQSVTIPANTFPGATIQWKVTATDDRGATTTSEVRTINTVDTLPVTTLIQPIDTLESNNKEILFRWQASNASGTAPTSYRLSWREAAVDPPAWTYEEFPAGTTQWLAPAKTFPPGEIYWWVLARNRDGTPGPWSSTGRFQSIGAPAAPVVTVEAAPFATITWQAVGQQAWRVTVDGQRYGPYFGTDKSFTLPDYLEDGEHIATVEVQGSYGLWSAAGTAAFSVANAPGDGITLKATCYRDAALRWETESATADFLVYRDGIRIGHTTRTVWNDRTALGAHAWQVVNRLPDGNYTASNIVQGALMSCTPAVALLAGGEWLELKKSDEQAREDAWSRSRVAAVRHFAGEIYPTAEFSTFEDESVSLTVAWLPGEAEEARRFEAKIGQTVIYKNRDRVLVGVMQGFSLRRPQFYRSYAVTLTRTEWRDYVDEDP